MRVARQDAETGVLGREEEMRELSGKIERLEKQVERQTLERQSVRAEIEKLEAQRSELQASVSKAGKEHAAAAAALGNLRDSLEKSRQRVLAQGC